MKEKISGNAGVSLLGGDYEVVTTKKRGTLFIEARIRDGLEDEVDASTVLIPFYLCTHLLTCAIRKFQRQLERQLSRPNQIFNLFTDLLVDEYGEFGLSLDKMVCENPLLKL